MVHAHRRPGRRLLISVVLTAVLVASTTAIVAAQTGAVGTGGSTAANAPTKPPALTGSAFWSGPTTDTLAQAGSVRSLGEAGPIPQGWWSITGQLTITGVQSDGLSVTCDLLSSGATQKSGTEFSGGFQLAELYSAPIGQGVTVTIPIRMLVEVTGFTQPVIADIQCLPAQSGAVYSLAADLLVLPTLAGKVGL